MSVAQSDFARALLDPERATPEGLTDPQGRPAGRRFSVYRNNIAVSLTEALFTAFPVIAKLVGEGNFRVLASVYLRQHPPETPVLMFYGAQMPAFLEGFEPARSLPYLSDMARLELAVRHAYHAEDAEPIAPEALQALPPDRLMAARLVLAPALRVIPSPWPIASIWRRNMLADEPVPAMHAEDTLVTRPAFDPVVTALPPGGGAFVSALSDGLPFGQAFDRATEAADAFDLTNVLSALIAQSAITDILEGPEP